MSAGPPTIVTTVTTVAMVADDGGMFCTLGAVPYTMALCISLAYINRHIRNGAHAMNVPMFNCAGLDVATRYNCAYISFRLTESKMCLVSFPHPQYGTHTREQRVWWIYIYYYYYCVHAYTC